MSRVKTFEATGVAPNGRLYAGDLNAIQDHYADLANFAQTVDVNSIRIGDSSLQLLKFGTGEVRLTSAVRTDGILRGLGGLISGAFTDAQRDAIGSGLAPKGIVIYNTDSDELQYNAGTDAVRVWMKLSSEAVGGTPSGRVVGEIIPWAGDPAALTGIQEPVPGWLLANGAAISRATYSALFAFCGTAYGVGDGATTFNLPDFRGRTPYGKNTSGTLTTRGASGGATTHTLSLSEMPIHKHDVGVTVNTGGAHAHTIQIYNMVGELIQVGAGVPRLISPASGPFYITEVAGSHGHTASASESNKGSGSAHQNMPPYQVIGGWLVKY